MGNVVGRDRYYLWSHAGLLHKHDLKRFIAYTSVSHMGFVLLGIFTFREMAFRAW